MNVKKCMYEIDNIFENIIQDYRPFDDNNQRKYDHTKEVVEISQNLFKSRLNEKKDLIMYIIATFHDIGRFEENKIFNNINDKNKFDHAEYSTKVLAQNKEFNNFISKYKLKNYKNKILNTIFYHNKLEIPSQIKTKYFKILRDADKISILHLVQDERIMNLALKQKFTRENLNDFYNMKCIDNKNIKTDSDRMLKYFSFIYDINYIKSYFEIKNIINDILKKIVEKNTEITNEIEKIHHLVNNYIDEKKGG